MALIGIFALALAAQSATSPNEAPGYSNGPFNLVLRWGEGSPVIVRYENRDRCEVAALEAWSQGMASVDEKTGKETKLDPAVSGANAPYAFCIPG